MTKSKLLFTEKRYPKCLRQFNNSFVKNIKFLDKKKSYKYLKIAFGLKR